MLIIIFIAFQFYKKDEIKKKWKMQFRIQNDRKNIFRCNGNAYIQSALSNIY